MSTDPQTTDEKPKEITSAELIAAGKKCAHAVNYHGRHSPYPITNHTLRKASALKDACPECGGHLDTGFECNRCGFDCAPLVAKQHALAVIDGGRNA